MFATSALAMGPVFHRYTNDVAVSQQCQYRVRRRIRKQHFTEQKRYSKAFSRTDQSRIIQSMVQGHKEIKSYETSIGH